MTNYILDLLELLDDVIMHYGHVLHVTDVISMKVSI